MTIFLICIGAIGIIIFILPYLLISANPFPQPSGKWHVITTDLIWDKPDLPGIIAKVWYPTEIKNNIPAPYIDRIDTILSAITAGKIHYINLFSSFSIADSFLYRKINEAKIFAAGHSIGGAASFIACGQDGRLRWT